VSPRRQLGEEVLGWFIAGFVAGALSLARIPDIPDSSIALFLLGIFLGIVLPILDIFREAQDVATRKWSWICGLAYATGLLFVCYSLISGGTPFLDLAWPILEGVTCGLVSFIALLRRLIL
jgi:hypothetical protein